MNLIDILSQSNYSERTSKLFGIQLQYIVWTLDSNSVLYEQYKTSVWPLM